MFVAPVLNVSDHTPWTQHGVKSNLLRRYSLSNSSLLSAWINGCFAPPRSSLKIDRESRAEFQSVFGLSVGEFPGFISSNGSRQRLCKLWRWSAHRTINLKSLMKYSYLPCSQSFELLWFKRSGWYGINHNPHSVSHVTPLKSNLNFSYASELLPEFSWLQKSCFCELWNYFSNIDIMRIAAKWIDQFNFKYSLESHTKTIYCTGTQAIH